MSPSHKGGSYAFLLTKGGRLYNLLLEKGGRLYSGALIYALYAILLRKGGSCTKRGAAVQSRRVHDVKCFEVVLFNIICRLHATLCRRGTEHGPRAFRPC